MPNEMTAEQAAEKLEDLENAGLAKEYLDAVCLAASVLRRVVSGELVEVLRCRKCANYINTKFVDCRGISHETNYFCELEGRNAGRLPTDFCNHGKRKDGDPHA